MQTTSHRHALGRPGRPVALVPSGNVAPRPQMQGTVLMIIGLLLTGVFLTGERPSQVAHFAAIGVGLSIACSLFFDVRAGGWQSVIRADVLAILALYFLTLFEFYFPQENFDSLTTLKLADQAVIGCLWGFAGLAIGRHIPNLRQQPLTQLFTSTVPRGWLILLFWACFLGGFIHKLISVEFDVLRMIHFFMAPRFTQPWQRGRLGDWWAILSELEMLLYLIPPLAGVIFARRKTFNFLQLLTTLGGLAFVLFYGFTSGTRNVFAAYMVTFLIGYSFARQNAKPRELIILSGTVAVLLLGATFSMLKFRGVGFQNYVQGKYEVTGATEKSLFVDYNLFSICQLMSVFPKQHAYLGFEVPYLALIRPIPRVFWSGKPEGMSMTLESAVGVEDMTVSASFVGEAYMSGGLIAVFATGIFFGFATGWWGHLASPRNSELGVLIYASGFFAAVISMRSIFVFTTALLPTAAAIVAGSYLVGKLRDRHPKAQRPVLRPASPHGISRPRR